MPLPYDADTNVSCSSFRDETLRRLELSLPAKQDSIDLAQQYRTARANILAQADVCIGIPHEAEELGSRSTVPCEDGSKPMDSISAQNKLSTT